MTGTPLERGYWPGTRGRTGPSRRRRSSRCCWPARRRGSAGRDPSRFVEIGGPPLLRLHFFLIAVGGEVVIAALVLLGLRLLALLAIPALAVYVAMGSLWVLWIPIPLRLITVGVLLLEMAALVASPGPAAAVPWFREWGWARFATDLLGHPSPENLAILFLPPVLIAVGIVGTTGLRAAAVRPAPG